MLGLRNVFVVPKYFPRPPTRKGTRPPQPLPYWPVKYLLLHNRSFQGSITPIATLTPFSMICRAFSRLSGVRSTYNCRRPTRLASPVLKWARCISSYDSTFTTTDPYRKPSAIARRLPDPDSVEAGHRFREFEVRSIAINSFRESNQHLKLDGRVFVVTGGARGLGLTLAEALVEAGGNGKLYHASSRENLLIRRPSILSRSVAGARS